MTPSSDNYQTQCGQFTAYLGTRREAMVAQWLAECVQDQALGARVGSAGEDTDLFRDLLQLFTRRIAAEPAGDGVERAARYGFHRWQRGYTLTELLAYLNNGYNIFDLAINQYLELHPQTQPQVINQAHKQLLQLSQEVTRGCVLSVDQQQRTTAMQQVQTLQLALDSLHQQINDRVDQQHHIAHDLRASLGIISSAASLLKLAADDDERAKYVDMITRNVKAAVPQLNQLLAHVQLETSDWPDWFVSTDDTTSTKKAD